MTQVTSITTLLNGMFSIKREQNLHKLFYEQPNMNTYFELLN